MLLLLFFSKMIKPLFFPSLVCWKTSQKNLFITYKNMQQNNREIYNEGMHISSPAIM